MASEGLQPPPKDRPQSVASHTSLPSVDEGGGSVMEDEYAFEDEVPQG